MSYEFINFKAVGKLWPCVGIGCKQENVPYTMMQITDVQINVSHPARMEEEEDTLVLATEIQESNFLAFRSLVFKPLVFVPNVVFMRHLCIKNKRTVTRYGRKTCPSFD